LSSAKLAGPLLDGSEVRIDQADRQKLAKTREGETAARQQYKPVIDEYSVGQAMEVVQIDHTLVDLFVVNAVNRQPLQRPWLTLAIDIASRMVAGFYLSLEHPSSTSVALAIRHMVLLKASWLVDRKVVGDWPVMVCQPPFILTMLESFEEKRLPWVRQNTASTSSITGCSPTLWWSYRAAYRHNDGCRPLSPGSTSSDIGSRGDYDPQ